MNSFVAICTFTAIVISVVEQQVAASKKSELADSPVPRLRFGKRDDFGDLDAADPRPRLRFGKRDDDVMPRLRFGKRNDGVLPRLRFGKRVYDEIEALVDALDRQNVEDQQVVESAKSDKREELPSAPRLRFG